MFNFGTHYFCGVTKNFNLRETVKDIAQGQYKLHAIILDIKTAIDYCEKNKRQVIYKGI